LHILGDILLCFFFAVCTDVNVNGNVLANSGIYSRGDLLSLNSAANGWNTVISRNNGSPIITALGGFVGNLTGNVTGSLTGDASTATKLTTPRTISATGDGAWSTSFDGSANATGTLTLATLLTAGSAGGATSVPTLTWDAKGRLTAVGSAAISIPHTQINDWAANVNNVYLPLTGGTMTGSLFGSISINIGASTNWWGSGFFTNLYVQNSPVLTANQSISLTGAVTGSGTTSIATSFANTHLAGINQDLTTTSSPTFATVTANLTGHASLDIPLTGSVAVTGSIQTTQGLYAASGMVGMYSIYDNIFTIGNNAHNIQVNNTTGETNFKGLTSVSMPGSLTVSGSFTPAVNIQSAVSYTITSSDQGKMILSNGQLSLPESGIPTGFWCIVSWHVGGGGVKFGPTTSGTNWYLRGTSITTSTSIPFSGIVSWDGYTWYAG